jgi:hypothetical protein
MCDHVGFRPHPSSEHLGRVHADTGRLALPLEAFLSDCDEVVPGLGTRFALTTLAYVVPNVLHDLIADAVLDGGATVISMNFDMLIEQAHRAKTGTDPASWAPGEPVPPLVRLWKLHGSAGRPSTLRYSLRTVNQRYDAASVRRIAALARQPMVVLGYAGADYDVMALLDVADGDGLPPVLWLERPNEPPPPGAVQLAARRRVLMVRGDFSDVLLACGRPDAPYLPDGRGTWPAIEQELRHEPPEAVSRILVNAIYQARVAQPELEPLWSAFRIHLAQDSRRKLFWQASAAENQFVGSNRGLLRSAWHRLLGAEAGHVASALSDALDAIERLGGGALRRAFVPAAPIHLLAARGPIRTEAARARIRWMRAVGPYMPRRRARASWSRLLDKVEGDPYLQGLVRLRLALVLARSGDSGWQELLDAAEETFRFGGRTAELGDLFRTRAACAITVGDLERSATLSEQARALHARYGQLQSARATSWMLAVLRRAPRTARRALWLM